MKGLYHVSEGWHFRNTLGQGIQVWPAQVYTHDVNPKLYNHAYKICPSE